MPKSSNNPMTANDLTKLTVPELKAICKERKITAYSKLAKCAIIQKIIEHAAKAAGSLTPVALPTEDASHRQIDATETVSASNAITENNPQPSRGPSHPGRAITPMNVDAYEDLASLISNSPGPRINNKKDPPELSASSVPPITHPTATTQLRVLAADNGSRKGIPRSPIPANNSNSGLFSLPAISVSSLASVNIPQPQKPTAGLELNASVLPNFVQAQIPRRFVPLVVKKPDMPQVPQITPLAVKAYTTAADTDFSRRLHDLDFPLTTPLAALKPITLPPSLSQRKKVTKLAMALIFVLPEDLHRLTRVSRLFRYAAYISAVHRLNRSFSGRRLTEITKKYSQTTINFWPYLRRREEERLARHRAYQDSFLGRAIKGKTIISDRIWASPDNIKQAIVAARFLLTRFFFHVSIGLEMDEKTMITDVQELVKEELWSIQIQSSKCTQIFYVLEATCEVVGHPPPLPLCSEPTAPSADAFSIRADWAAYIDSYVLSSRGTRPPSLMDHLKWTNHEEYDKGISRLWLSRTKLDGDIGVAKMLVAARYVLACVVSNSVSGRWMSSTEMAQEFDGLPSRVPHTRRDTALHLFLPAHHHVESLHFTSSGGKPLHPAVAVVQTPGREYYILKDNGMQIGCEETGVAEIWMQLLGCDALGRTVSVPSEVESG
ncbi:hypothetical protein FPV67DRAFT_1410683 [Lyophyllum atratum]|nr:hypothetical protein FPV67DRAFT_1410683 [Lyophyllum atratum]